MNVDIAILACQAERIPDAVNPGLSGSVTKALPKAAETSLKLAGSTGCKRKRKTRKGPVS